MTKKYFIPENESIHPDFVDSKKVIFDTCKFECSSPELETESAEYGACKFKLNNFDIIFRVAKITPAKVGQFVTVWKRLGKGAIQPFDVSDPFDFFIIATRQDDHFGQFVFSKALLYEHDVISENGQGGKRGIRVYPAWDKTTNKQAHKTQKWQLDHFIDVSKNQPDDNSNMFRYFQ
jgi:hypothetical protein